jgi:hypothetical protein
MGLTYESCCIRRVLSTDPSVISLIRNDGNGGTSNEEEDDEDGDDPEHNDDDSTQQTVGGFIDMKSFIGELDAKPSSSADHSISCYSTNCRRTITHRTRLPDDAPRDDTDETRLDYRKLAEMIVLKKSAPNSFNTYRADVRKHFIKHHHGERLPAFAYFQQIMGRAKAIEAGVGVKLGLFASSISPQPIEPRAQSFTHFALRKRP